MNDISIEEKKKIFGRCLGDLLAQTGRGQKGIADYLGLSIGRISHFVTGLNLPTDDAMEMITEYLSRYLSENDLIRLMKFYMDANSKIPSLIDQKSRSVLENHFINLFHQLTEQQQYKLLQHMLQLVEDNYQTQSDMVKDDHPNPQYPEGNQSRKFSIFDSAASSKSKHTPKNNDKNPPSNPPKKKK